MTSQIFTEPVFYDVNLRPSAQKYRGISYTISRFLRCTILGPGGAGGDGVCLNNSISIVPGGGGGGGGGSSIIILFNIEAISTTLYIFPGIGGKSIQGNNGQNGGVTAIILNDNFTLIVPGGKGGQIPTSTSGGNGGDGGEQPYLILNDDINNTVPYTYLNQNVYIILQPYQCFGGGASVTLLNTNLNFISGTPGKGFPTSQYDGANASLLNVNGKDYYLSGAGGGASSAWGGDFLSYGTILYASGGSGGSYGVDNLPIIIGPLRLNPIIDVDNNVSQSGIGASNKKTRGAILSSVRQPDNIAVVEETNNDRYIRINPQKGAPGGGGGGGETSYDKKFKECIGVLGANGGNGKIIFI